jgi:hypothetical protein
LRRRRATVDVLLGALAQKPLRAVTKNQTKNSGYIKIEETVLEGELAAKHEWNMEPVRGEGRGARLSQGREGAAR